MEIQYGIDDLVDYDFLMKNKLYSHLVSHRKELIITKLSTLELLRGWKSVRWKNSDEFGDVTIYMTILEIELDYINQNLTTLDLAIKMKVSEAVDFLDTGDYYKN
jgi:hypothetical protein